MAYQSSTLIDPAESLIAITGIGLLTGERQASISEEEITRAQKLAATIETKTKSAFNGSLTARAPAPVNFRRSIKRLSSLQHHEDITERMLKFPRGYSKLAISYNLMLHQMQSSILKMMPVQTWQSVGGTETAPPSDLKFWKFLSILQVIDEPLSVFRLIANGQLLKKQALAIKTVYPTLAESITTALASCWIDHKTTHADYRPGWILYQGLSAWFESSPMPPSLMARAQAAHIRMRQQKQQQDQAGKQGAPSDALSPSGRAQFGQV